MAAADPQQARSRQLSTSGTSLYELLGLEKTATQEQIKKSYRKKALTCHPDKNQGDEAATELFKQINHANSVLTDETKKKIYDQYGSMGLHLASQIGEERFGTYLLLQKPWAKVLCGVLVILTGCCCCCCCCFCCNCCCGKCGPQPEYDDEENPTFDDTQTDGDNAAPVTNEPISMGPPPAAASPTAAGDDSFHDDREVLITVDANTPIALGPPPGQPTSYGSAE